MNDIDNRNREEKAERVGRRLSGYAKVALLMLVVLPLMWALAGGIDLQFAVAANPELEKAMEQASQALLDGEDSSVWMKTCAQVVMDASPNMHWFTDALLSGIVSCALLGILLGYWTDDPSWAGFLPVLFIFSGMNPACMGDGAFIQPMPMTDQFLVLAGQCTAMHLMAYRVFERRCQAEKMKRTLS